MEKIAIMTDVNAGLDYTNHPVDDIAVIRSVINFGDEHYVDGIDIKADQFYDKLTKTDVIPSTSAPTPGETMEVIERLIKEGYTDVIMFAISYSMSCIGSMVESVGEEYKDKIKVHVINTKTAAFLQGFLAINANNMVKEGRSVEEIIKRTNWLIDHGHSYFVVDNLKYLVKNGRLKGFAGAIGALLKIKPVLEINDKGNIVVNTKIRTHKKAMKVAVDKIIEEMSKAKKVALFVFHTCREEDCVNLKGYFEKADVRFKDIEMHMVTPAVGAHIGPGILGFGYYILDEEE